MASRGGIRTPPDYFKYNEDHHLPVPDFNKKYSTEFPLLAIIIDGIYGVTIYDSYDCSQVTRIHCCTAQPRVVCIKEDDARKSDARYLTIPVKTNLKFKVIRSRRKVSQPMTLTEILHQHKLPVLVNIHSPDDRKSTMIKIGTIPHAAQTIGNLLIIDKYEANYLKMNCVNMDGSELKMNVTACMLAMTKEITVTPILGFKDQSNEEFKQYLTKLDKIAASHPEQYDRTDGDPNWSEFNWHPSDNDNIPIKIKTFPADALKIIRSFLDEPLLPPPPLIPGASGGDGPPPRPKPLARTKSQETTSPRQLQDDSDEDYEVPETDKFPIPKNPPKLPERTQSVKVPNVQQKKQEKGKYSYLLVTKPKGTINMNEKDNASDNIDGTKDDNKTQKRPLTDLEVHTRESGRVKDGYVNTKIDRAVVRPQLKLPESAHVDDDGGDYDTVYEDPDSQNYYIVTETERREEDIPTSTSGESQSTSIQNKQKPQPQKRQHIQQQQQHPQQQQQQQQQPSQQDNLHPSTSTVRNNSQSEEVTFAGVSELTITQVSDALRKLNLGQYVDKFKENSIDGAILNELTVDDFVQEIGMKKLEAVRLNKYVKTGHIPK